MLIKEDLNHRRLFSCCTQSLTATYVFEQGIKKCSLETLITMLLPLRLHSRYMRASFVLLHLVSFLPPPFPSLHSSILPSSPSLLLSSPLRSTLHARTRHTDLLIASSGIMTNDSPEEESRVPGGGGGKGIVRRNRADDNVTILTSSMDLHRAGRSRASSSSNNDAAPSLTSSVDLSTSSLELSIQTRIFKIIVIGDSNVGKTCLTFRFTGGSFPDKTEATIGVDFREKAVEIEGETIKVRATEGLDVDEWCFPTASSSPPPPLFLLISSDPKGASGSSIFLISSQ